MNDIIDNQYHRDCFFDSGNENWDWQNLSKKSHNNITNGKELSMQIVIDIPEELYKECQGDIYYPDTGGELWEAVKNGTQLPKSHGRLIDVKQIVTEDECIWNSDGSCTTITTYDIDSTSTIVEADKMESEE